MDLIFFGDGCKIILINKRRKMIATAIALQDATKDAVMHDLTVVLAKEIYENKDYMDTETFAKAMFEYSAHLSSLTATLVLDAVLTKSQISEMMDTIKEMESMGKDVASE
jgi:thiamine phosphate synthase YjbQ (UPF0047 family)